MKHFRVFAECVGYFTLWFIGALGLGGVLALTERVIEFGYSYVL